MKWTQKKNCNEQANGCDLLKKGKQITTFGLMKSTRQQSMWIEHEEHTSKYDTKNPFPKSWISLHWIQQADWLRHTLIKSVINGNVAQSEKTTFCYKFFCRISNSNRNNTFFSLFTAHHNLSFDWNRRMDLMKSFSLTLMFTLTICNICDFHGPLSTLMHLLCVLLCHRLSQSLLLSLHLRSFVLSCPSSATIFHSVQLQSLHI